MKDGCFYIRKMVEYQESSIETVRSLKTVLCIAPLDDPSRFMDSRDRGTFFPSTMFELSVSVLPLHSDHSDHC